MTVIAWDGTSLAADKMTDFGGLHATTTTVQRIRGCLVAGCGNAALVRELQAWFADGAEPARFPAAQRDLKECCSLLVVQPGGVLLQYENGPFPLVLEKRHWAIGSGRDFAMMAMHLGKSARQACELTAELCNTCGNGVDSMVL